MMSELKFELPSCVIKADQIDFGYNWILPGVSKCEFDAIHTWLSDIIFHPKRNDSAEIETSNYIVTVQYKGTKETSK